MEVRRTPAGSSGALIGAAILIVIGVSALVANLGGGNLVATLIPLVIGLSFMVAYALTRIYGYLVPGGILTGLGAGLVIATLAGANDNGPYVVIGLGLGFLLIYGLDMLVAGMGSRWWPVIPGGILLLIGTGMAAQNTGLVNQVGTWSPVLLILLGVLILVTRGRPVRR